MTYYSLRQFHKMTGNALHILRRDAKELFRDKQVQGVVSEYTLNEGFVLYLYAYLVSVKKFSIDEANFLIRILLPYLKKKGLLPEGKKPKADEHRDQTFTDEFGQTQTILNAAIVYPTMISIFYSIMHGPEDQIVSDYRIVANREDVKEHDSAGGLLVAMVKRITETVHEPDEGFDIDLTKEWILPVSKLLKKFNEDKHHYDCSN
jgi:hypothetical protein